jgi:hypothetical protein
MCVGAVIAAVVLEGKEIGIRAALPPFGREWYLLRG